MHMFLQNKCLKEKKKRIKASQLESILNSLKRRFWVNNIKFSNPYKIPVYDSDLLVNIIPLKFPIKYITYVLLLEQCLLKQKKNHFMLLLLGVFISTIV